MSDFRRPETIEEYYENFAQIKPLMNATAAYYESSRCLFCYDAPCVTACPTGIDIPLFIRQIGTGNVTGAARTIYSSNYFGHTCGKVCPTEVLCEGACVYNHQDVKPIEIGRLQSFASTEALSKGERLFIRMPATEMKVAVIGAGPAGIACACELSALGHHVEIFEAKSRPSGLALHGTAPYKITNQEVLDEVTFLQEQLGFQIHYNQPIDTIREWKDLDSAFDAVFLGIGLGETRKAGIPGEDMKGCIGATEFIEGLKTSPLETWVGKQVIVVGGGNTAMDACSESARMGADVILLYRRDKDSMSAYHFEYDMIRDAGARAMFNTVVIEIRGNEKVREVVCSKTIVDNGNLSIAPDSSFILPCDMVIKATGQEKQTSLLDLFDIQYDGKGCIVTDEYHRCGETKYFAGGDAVNGGAEVVNACAEGKAAAQSINRYLLKEK